MAHLEHRDFFLFNDISGMSIENELLEDGFPLDFFSSCQKDIFFTLQTC